ncbi:MAG: hypothetical protein R3E95_23945 [Thiolinea sp.]
MSTQIPPMFSGQSELLNLYLKQDIKSVLKSVIRDLEKVEALALSASSALAYENTAPNEKITTALAGSAAFELRLKLEILQTGLTQQGADHE